MKAHTSNLTNTLQAMMLMACVTACGTMKPNPNMTPEAKEMTLDMRTAFHNDLSATLLDQVRLMSFNYKIGVYKWVICISISIEPIANFSTSASILPANETKAKP